MTLTLAPKSQRAFEKCWALIEQVMVVQPGSFFFTRRGSRIAALHSSVNCTTSMVGSARLFPRISLIYLAYVGYLHSIKKWYVYIQLLYYLDKFAELFVGHRLPYPL
jgi:hypothetical protein